VFTGLIADVGRVGASQQTADGVRLRVDSALADELSEGDSVAVNGVCLTARDIGADAFQADVMRETLSRSSLGRLEEGDSVNLELPLRAQDRLGGHVVQGHVDALGTVVEREPDGFAARLTIEADPALLRYVVEKGSIAVDGVSLTVAEVGEGGFAVSLIPETLSRTTLGRAGPGTPVNLEVDVLAKYVEKLSAGVRA
jgi:riboflavin synthase